MAKASPPLGEHQEFALDSMAENLGLLIEYGTGCLSGDTLIPINRGSNGQTVRIDYLYHMFNGGRSKAKGGLSNGPRWNPAIPTQIQRSQEGVIRLTNIKNVWCSGVKKTYLLTTEAGRTIRATAEHPFLTPHGWSTLGELEVGVQVYVRENQAGAGRVVKPRYTDIYGVPAHPYAQRRHRKDRPTDQYRVCRHRLVAEARLNDLPYPTFLSLVRSGEVKGLKFIDPKHYDVHHKDHNSRNDDPDNLEVLSSVEHPRRHAEEGTYKNVLFKVGTDWVQSIEPYGEEVTYDIEVEGEPHNFIANEFVVHNTGKTRVIAEALKLFISGGEMPCLVLTPNSLLEQTYEQCVEWVGKKWTERNVCWVGSWLEIYKRREQIKRGNWPIYLVSHESMSYRMMREALTSKRWAAVLVDEASRFRNYSQRTVTLRGVGRRSDSRYAFTGNLTVRNPADCWYVTNFLRPGVWGTHDRKTWVTSWFTLGGFTGVDPQGIRPDKRKEFFAILDGMRIQCELSDLRVMPDRIMTVRRTTMGKEQAQAYEQMRKTLKVEIERVSDDEFVSRAKTYAVRLLRLQEIAAGFARNNDGEVVYFRNPKTEEMIESILDDPLTPTIIWYWFKPEGQLIRSMLEKHGIYYEWLKAPGARQRFMDGQFNILVAQMGTGGYGLNLTRAEKMEYHSLPWDLDTYSQGTERNRRLNTTDPTKGYHEIVHNIITGTCEEYVRQKLISKAGMARQFSRSQALAMLAP